MATKHTTPVTALLDVLVPALGEKNAAVSTSMLMTVALSTLTFGLCLPLNMLTQWSRTAFQGTGVLDSPWTWLRANGGHFISSPAFPVLLAVLFYFVAGLGFVILDLCDFQALRKYKIRGVDRPPSTMADWTKTLKYQLTTIVMFIVPGVVFQMAVQGPWLYRDSFCVMNCDGEKLLPLTAPSLAEFVLHVGLSLFVFDFCFFVWHKNHHQSRVLYRHIHSLHHEYYAPFVWVRIPFSPRIVCVHCVNVLPCMCFRRLRNMRIPVRSLP